MEKQKSVKGSDPRPACWTQGSQWLAMVRHRSQWNSRQWCKTSGLVCNPTGPGHCESCCKIWSTTRPRGELHPWLPVREVHQGDVKGDQRPLGNGVVGWVVEAGNGGLCQDSWWAGRSARDVVGSAGRPVCRNVRPINEGRNCKQAPVMCVRACACMWACRRAYVCVCVRACGSPSTDLLQCTKTANTMHAGEVGCNKAPQNMQWPKKCKKGFI